MRRMLGLLALIIVVAFSVRAYTDRQAGGGQPEVSGAPEFVKHRALNAPTGVKFKARVRLAWTHRAGADPTPARLIKARRLAEASLAIGAEDHKGRVMLALRREGPLPDLLLAQRGRPGFRRNAARAILCRLYPGENWGFKPTPFVPTFGAGDPLKSAFESIPEQASGLQLAAAARIARRVVRAYPEADTCTATALQLAYFEVLRGKGAAARAVTVSLASSDTSPDSRDQASRLSQRIAAAMRDGAGLGPVRAGKPRLAITRMRQSAQRGLRPWPTSPHDLITLVADRRREVADRELDPEVVARCLDQGFDVWVSVLDALGAVQCVPVIAVEANVRAVLLADGKATDWESLARASVWGRRMAVVHPVGAHVPGKSSRTPFHLIPCPRGANGELEAGPEAVEALRAGVRRLPEDALASYLYAVALGVAEQHSADGAARGDELRRHLAVSAARFPDAMWPLAVLAERAGVDDDWRPGALLTLGIAGTMPLVTGVADSEAAFDPTRADALLRDELVSSPARFGSIQDSALRAAVRRDGKDVDAHLDLLGRMQGEHPAVMTLRQLREIVWRGPEAAINFVPGSPSDPDGATMRLNLAAHSGRSQVLRHHSEMHPHNGPRHESRDVKVLLAMHSGDYQKVLDEAANVITTEGVGPVVCAALVDAAQTLADPQDTRLTSALSGGIRSGDRGVLQLAADLGECRHDLALDILRATIGAPGDAVEAHFQLAATLVAHAPAAPLAQRETLAKEALAALEAIEYARSTFVLWECVQAAAWRHIDPDRAFEVIKGITSLPSPLVPFLLASAIATQRGDDQLADRMIGRAANLEIIRNGIGWAHHFGISPQLDLVFGQVDVDLLGAQAWLWYGRGGRLPSLPPVPRFGEPGLSTEALWRLVEDREYDIAGQALAHRWLPQDFLTFGDGAPRVAVASVLAVVQGDPSALAAALEESRHPAYLRAAAVCLNTGVGLVDPHILAAAPGLVSGEASAVVPASGAGA